MPLIDEAETLLDVQLMSHLVNNFTTRNGLIIDKYGNSWFRWRADGLDSWWRMFEETIDSPMGRKLANSACDEEEWLLNNGSLDHTGFFRKKKALKSLAHRWKINGWGTPKMNPPSFRSTGLNPIFAGILQADIERINSQRYRMRWEEKSSESCVLQLDESDYPITASKQSVESFETGEPYLIEVEEDWRIDGLSHHLLPSGLFNRLQDSCAGLNANIGEDERGSWPDESDGFLSMAIASKNLFIAGEEIFLAADADGWMQSCDAFFSPMGFSKPQSVKSIDSNGGIELIYSQVPVPAITLGMLAGAWIRSEGRPVKVGLSRDENSLIITLQSRYELS